ncbi:MAG: cell division protein FtsZ [Rickettsiales bacterium]|nr:cell division protein FtsZ [Rickettsiales bacterium]
MTLHLQMPSQVNNMSPRILVVGVGGAGGNIINSMKESGVEGVEFLNVNTDSQQLKHSKVEKTLQLGPSCTKGLGAGADPEMGKKSADEVAGEIEDYLEGAHMVFLTAGMGGGTGTGATPVVARIAKDLGILTVGVVTKPFEMEGKRKIKRAKDGIMELQKYVDNLIVIPNQNIFHLAKPETSFVESLQFADNVLIDGVKSIIDLMVNPGIMNHDFADVRAIMSETGKVHLGTGISEGENRVMEATEMAISNPLLENNSMKGAKGVLINVTCSDDTSLHDIDLAINRVQEESDDEANIIWGVQKDESFSGKFKISVISTGIDCENYYKNIVEESNVTNLRNKEDSLEKKIDDKDEKNSFLQNRETIQTSFFVDLQDTSKKVKENDLKIEKKSGNIPSEKRSIFSKIFGLKHNVKNESNIDKDEQNITNFDNNSENNENDSLQNLSNESIQEIKSEFEMIDDFSEYDKQSESQNSKEDDLLQIPAFLRRQAN